MTLLFNVLAMPNAETRSPYFFPTPKGDIAPPTQVIVDRSARHDTWVTLLEPCPHAMAYNLDTGSRREDCVRRVLHRFCISRVDAPTHPAFAAFSVEFPCGNDKPPVIYQTSFDPVTGLEIKRAIRRNPKTSGPFMVRSYVEYPQEDSEPDANTVDTFDSPASSIRLRATLGPIAAWASTATPDVIGTVPHRPLPVLWPSSSSDITP